jgi:hypothetical protein
MKIIHHHMNDVNCFRYENYGNDGTFVYFFWKLNYYIFSLLIIVIYYQVLYILHIS